MTRAVEFSPDGAFLSVGLGGRMGGTRASKDSKNED